MSIVFASQVAALLQQAALPDTIVTKQIAQRGWLETLVSVEQAIVGLLSLVLLAAVVLMLVALRKGLQELTSLLQNSTKEVSQATTAVRNVADDVKHVVGKVRDEMDDVVDTVRSVHERVRDAVDSAEVRVRRFGALVDVAQEEAEDLVVSAAATMRGMRAGTDVLRRTLTFARFGGQSQAVRHPRRRRGYRDRDHLREDGGIPRGPYTRSRERDRV
jgi:hypothetical protein